MGMNHFDENGNAVMVDVSQKNETERIAVADGVITMNEAAFSAAVNRTAKKGDVFTVAQVAGIMGAKRTFEMIPMCHILMLTSCKIEFETGNNSIKAICTVKTSGKTGVEMEALNGVSTALLTIYDMLKALDRSMEIKNIRLLEKDGGKSGKYVRTEG